MSSRSLSLVFAGMLLAVPAPALAYSSPSLYAAPTHEGGGGGRYFTGSRADGLSCGVCHGGGEPLELEVLGLPVGGWQPGVTYTIDVAWSPSTEHAAILAELSDAAGLAVGQLSLPPDDLLTNAERCSSGTRAASTHEPDGPRRILAVGDCGAHRLRFQWQAPTELADDVWLHLASVRADGSGDVNGDGASLVQFQLEPIGADDPGCRAVGDPPAPILLAVLLAVGCVLVRRPRSSVVLALGLVSLAGCARVQPWERGRLAQPDMQMELDPELLAGSEHALEYREGSAGALGGSGGGCGCN